MQVTINGIPWTVERVSPNNPALVDEGEESQHRLGVTWYITKNIYVSDELDAESAKVTLMHELTHAYVYCTQVQGLSELDEEDLCNFVGMYGERIVNLASEILGVWNES